jgi:hypothetical protein
MLEPKPLLGTRNQLSQLERVIRQHKIVAANLRQTVRN